MRYLKTYMGVITNSMGGRDDGYPEIKIRIYDSIEQLSKDYGKRPEEHHYELNEISPDILKEKIKEIKSEKRTIKDIENRKAKEEQFEILKSELGK